MESNFNEIKQEILRRAKKAGACKFQYSRAYTAESLSELSEVIKDNFYWVCTQGVLTVDLIEQYKEDFSANDIYANQDVERGYLLCDSATVKAYGNTIVKAYGNSKVEAYDSATVEAFDSAAVRAYDSTMIQANNNATVKAFNDSKVGAYDNTTVKAYGSATVRAYYSATVEAYDGAMVDAYDYTKVEAHNNAYCTSYYTIDCKLFDHAIYRVRDTNTIHYADSDIEFAKR